MPVSIQEALNRPADFFFRAVASRPLPLAIESGTGAELRFPLGISIIGGLLLSQLLTLYTTPVIYLALDRLRDAAYGRKITARAVVLMLPPFTRPPSTDMSQHR